MIPKEKQLKSILIDLETGEIDKYAAFDLIQTLYKDLACEFAEWCARNSWEKYLISTNWVMWKHKYNTYLNKDKTAELFDKFMAERSNQ